MELKAQRKFTCTEQPDKHPFISDNLPQLMPEGQPCAPNKALGEQQQQITAYQTELAQQKATLEDRESRLLNNEGQIQRLFQ